MKNIYLSLNAYLRLHNALRPVVTYCYYGYQFARGRGVAVIVTTSVSVFSPAINDCHGNSLAIIIIQIIQIKRNILFIISLLSLDNERCTVNLYPNYISQPRQPGTNFKLILLDCGGEEPTLTQEPNDIIVNLYE